MRKTAVTTSKSKPKAAPKKAVLRKPCQPMIVVVREGSVPGEHTHITYLVTGAVAVLVVVFSPILAPLWAVGWLWHNRHGRDTTICDCPDCSN